MKSACVIGWPIEHSRSPLIHGYWLKKYGIAGSYTKRAVRPEEVGAFFGSMAELGLAGCNVTVPHKEAAFAAADERDPSAVAVKAANTLWLDGNTLWAANTDTYGYMTHLTTSAPLWKNRDAPVSILGAGGAARAIVYGFLQAGVGEVRVFNRTTDRADILARDFGGRVRVCDWVQREALSREASVIVNTTAVGLKGQGELGIDFAGFHPGCVVSDIVYVPLETAFMRAARLAGLATVDGLGMLLHQAVPGFERWFGVRPEVTPELGAIIEADIAGA
ncbi:MAG: shikimate dehydrogenase [Hyphomicrobiaceae bacterium]